MQSLIYEDGHINTPVGPSSPSGHFGLGDEEIKQLRRTERDTSHRSSSWLVAVGDSWWWSGLKTLTRCEKLPDLLGQLVLLRFHPPMTIPHLSCDLWAARLWVSVAVGVRRVEIENTPIFFALQILRQNNWILRNLKYLFQYQAPTNQI